MEEEKKDGSDATQQTYNKDEVIFREGDVSTELYILLQGEVGIYHKGTLMNKITEPISYFGEISSLTNSPLDMRARMLSSRGPPGPTTYPPSAMVATGVPRTPEAAPPENIPEKKPRPASPPTPP